MLNPPLRAPLVNDAYTLVSGVNANFAAMRGVKLVKVSSPEKLYVKHSCVAMLQG